jgi:NADH-quinone oxidoreductase subunit L
MVLSIVLAGLGIIWATGFYYEARTGKPAISPATGAAVIGPYHKVLWNKYYFDELYDVLFVRSTHLCSRVMALIDKWVVDGAVNACGHAGKWTARLTGFGLDNWGVDGIVNGVALLTGAVGDRLSYTATGKVRQYLLFIALGVIALSATLMVAIYLQ